MSRCGRCAVRLASPVATCGECLISPPPFDSALAAVDYEYPWDRLINDFKFKDAIDLADAMARLLIEAHARQVRTLPDLMLAVPLSVGRLRERGYNQSWELARRCARQLKCQSDDSLLLRIKDTPHQLGLPREERAMNVRGAFVVEPIRRSELRGRSVTLVDDVMTTQATAGEVTRTLLAAGAAAVHLWVVARTPLPSQ